jgi:hypothetical protein
VLEIVLGQTPAEAKPTVVADTPGSNSASATRALTASAISCTRLVFAAPSYTAVPAVVRRWHRDLWNVMPTSDRRRVVVVAGRSAHYLAPLIGDDVRIVAFVEDATEAAVALGLKVRMLDQLKAAAEKGDRLPRSIMPLVNAQSRALLGPWYDLDDFPVSEGPPPDADVWRARLFDDVLNRVSLLPAEAAPKETARIAADLKWFDKLALRYLEPERKHLSEKVAPASRKRMAAFSWLDGELRAAATAGPASR